MGTRLENLFFDIRRLEKFDNEEELSGTCHSCVCLQT